MNSLLRDFVFATRMLRKSPGFTLVAILSLSVGIGINSTVFGFVNAIMFKPMAVQNTNGLVYVFAGDSKNPLRNTSYKNYLEFRKQNEVFSGLAAYSAPPVLLTIGDHTEEINSEVVSGNYFSVLEVQMQRGRPLTLDDDQINATQPAVVISDAFWKRRLNSDPEILRAGLILNGNSFPVIGITAADFTGADPTVSTDVWIPVTQWATIIQSVPTNGVTKNEAQPAAGEAETQTKQQSRLNSDENWLSMIGRLKPGVSLEQARAAMTTVASRLDVAKAPEQKFKITLSPVSEVHPAIQQEFPLALFIMAAASLILVICCLNVASLMLARAAARQKEFAVRIALGSSRRRLVQQLLTESLLLSLIAGPLGLLLASWTTRLVLGLIPPGDLGLNAGIAIDQKVLWFSLVISVLTALIFGLVPALNSFRFELVSSLGSEGMSRGGVRRKISLRRALVVLQIVASLVLLIGAGLFLRSFQTGRTTNESFRSDKILLLNLSPRKYGYSVRYNKTFYLELLSRVGAMRGVEAVTLSNVVPLTMHRSHTMVGVGGREAKSLPRALVGEGYFQTLRVPVVAGREFNSGDDDRSHKVVIINEAMARTYWPGENALGKSIDMGGAHEIVGVAKDTLYNGFGKASEPYIYGSLYQRPDQSVSLIVRTSVEPKVMISAVQREIKELGANLPIFDFQTLDEVSSSQLTPVKATGALLSLLSFIGLLVASIGIYGVTSYAFSQRRREIGIRMTFGAQRNDILKLIMKEGMTLAAVGIVIGLLLALGTTHFLSTFLFGVSPVDPTVFLGVASLLAIVALGASLTPALSAARSNPVETLRHE